MRGYLEAMAARTATDWNKATLAAAEAAAGAKGAREVDHAFDLAEGRAKVLSQSLTTEVNGFAKVDTAKRVGKRDKTWTNASGKRPEHARVNGETVPVDEPFSNGQSWPGGPNCKCDVAFTTTYERVVEQPLTRKDLAIPDSSLSRTRAVSDTEYQMLAAEGRTLLTRWEANRASPAGLDDDWDGVRQRAWDSVQEEWGGTTIDAHTGVEVLQGQHKYAITVKGAGQDSVAVPIGATRAEFDAALTEARHRFADRLAMEKAHLGVFRNEETGAYEVDPVLIVDSRAEVERVGAFSRSKGGAYSFADGLGYWPPYLKEST